MWKQKLCMGVTPTLDISVEEQIRLFAETGFEAIFTGWDHGVPVKDYKRAADECGVEFQSIHAPFHKDSDVSKMWLPGDEGKTAANVLCECLEVCSDNSIGIMVSHVYSGFEHPLPTIARHRGQLKISARLPIGHGILVSDLRLRILRILSLTKPYSMRFNATVRWDSAGMRDTSAVITAGAI